MANALHSKIIATLPLISSTALETAGQLSLFDKAAYYFASRYLFDGRGVIIEAGTLFGASTVLLAQGLQDSATTVPIKRPIRAFDRFLLPSNELSKFYPEMPTRQRGDSFKDIFNANTREHSSLIDVIEGDILQHEHDGVPIGLLCLDICKTPEITRHVFATFLPHIDIGTYVLHQDHVHGNLPFNAIAFELFSDYFSRVAEDVSTALFQCVKKVDLDTVNRLLGSRPEGFYCREQEVTMNMAVERSLHRKSRFFMTLCLAMFYRDFRQHAKSTDVFVNALLEYRDVLANLDSVELELVQYYQRLHDRQLSGHLRGIERDATTQRKIAGLPGYRFARSVYRATLGHTRKEN